MTPYTYPKIISGDKLAAEILAAIGLVCIPSINGTTAEVLAPRALTAAEKTVLDATVAAHVPAAPRRLRQLAALMTDIQGLSALNMTKLDLLQKASFLQQNPRAARLLNIPVDGDEPDT